MRIIVALLMLSAGVAEAQTRDAVTVRVRVMDTANVPLENVAISVIQGLSQPLGSGTSDRAGLKLIRIANAPREFQVAARRVGFEPTVRVVARDWRDTIRVDLVLRRLTRQLDTVRVTAEQGLKRLKLTVDADAIAASDRVLIDATDIVFKMRPDMVYGLGGKFVCGAVQHVWVNGVRVIDPPLNGIMVAKANANARAGDAGSSALFGRSPVSAYSVYAELPHPVLSVLASLKPEHIQSIEMRDCRDRSIDKLGGDRAIFVTLKDGVHFDAGIGSYVGTREEAERLLQRITRPGVLTALRTGGDSASATPPPLEPYRLRLLGIFDAASGSALAGADVLDVTTGIRASTSETGTVSLAFMDPGAGRLVLSKRGYRSDTLSVTISSADTLPITVLLSPLAP